MPLFLELVRETALQEPEMARAALAGLRRYQNSSRAEAPVTRPTFSSLNGSSLRDCGGSGPTLVLVPSLINPPGILDLEPDCSLAQALAARHRVLLLDWGPAAERRKLDLDGHIDERLLPLVAPLGPAILVGYCLGGTLALAAAARPATIKAVATLAAPFDFAGYPPEARERLVQIWRASEAASTTLGYLPVEVLQSAFWQIDPARIVAKFARFARLEEGTPEARRFVTLEDWANGGEPLPLPAARQLAENLFATGTTLSQLPSARMLHVTASADRIVPAATVAPAGDHLSSASGHVGMIVGRDAPHRLHAPLLSWLEGVASGG